MESEFSFHQRFRDVSTSAQTGFETLQVSFAICSRFFSCSKVAGRVNLITHIHVLRLSMWGDIPLPSAVTSWHGV